MTRELELLHAVALVVFVCAGILIVWALAAKEQAEREAARLAEDNAALRRLFGWRTNGSVAR